MCHDSHTFRIYYFLLIHYLLFQKHRNEKCHEETLGEEGVLGREIENLCKIQTIEMRSGGTSGPTQSILFDSGLIEICNSSSLWQWKKHVVI